MGKRIAFAYIHKVIDFTSYEEMEKFLKTYDGKVLDKYTTYNDPKYKWTVVAIEPYRKYEMGC